jgi:hypothetical protein
MAPALPSNGADPSRSPAGAPGSLRTTGPENVPVLPPAESMAIGLEFGYAR